MSAPDVLVIGGGPAGMGAALEAANSGLTCVLVDESPELGGQIYRAPLPEAEQAMSPHPHGAYLRQKVRESSGIEVRTGCSAWGVFEGPEVPVSSEGSTIVYRPKALVIAPGAYEFVPPFPGWTLPGVMTPGAAQILVKTMGIEPGKRVILAGTGPFLPAVASQLVRAGVGVTAVLEASPRHHWWTLPWHGFRTPSILREGLGYLATLRRARVPILYRRGIVEVRGGERMTHVAHAPLDDHWAPNLSRREEIEADTLCVGYGFVPRVHLAQSAGCELEFRDEQGGWVPRRDAEFATSVEGVYSVGDGAGVAGAWSAESEGRIAGLAIARRLGALEPGDFDRQQRPWRTKLDRLTPIRRALDRICRIRSGLFESIQDDTLVCRCEELPWKTVRSAIDFGADQFRSLKVATRLGMGPCQGRFCWPATSRMIARQCQVGVEQVGPSSARPPLRPVSLGCLASMDEEAR